MTQLKLNIYKGTRGGRRPGSGRKRIHSRGVAHRTREKVNGKTPLHINFRVKTSIRNKECLKILKKAIKNARSQGIRILHFSLESNHVHLIIEATSNQILTKGMRSFTITFAKGINKGRIQFERYHLHVLKTLRETRNAIHYVLFNHQKHTGLKTAYVSTYSSLGVIKNLKELAKEMRMTVVLRGIPDLNFLDDPRSWLAKKSLNLQLIC
ncbi:transposase [Peredibacter sp. HCB2-198]|uniref:transposase n=1 Tax=Peredibacter sp. HCB2-198 TaxID=3383025 RepID=UPI0038B5A5E5